MHTKDLDSLLQLLHVSGRSGLLTVEPSGSLEGEPWQGQFVLAQGNVSSCLIRSMRDGRLLLQGINALRWLTRQGQLEWWITEQAQPANSSRAPAIETVLPPAQQLASSGQTAAEQRSRVPRRTLGGMYSRGQEAWSRDHRHVFALVDGKRSEQEIARMLGRSFEAVKKILRDLAAAGFIE